MLIYEHETAEKLIAQFLPLVDYVQGQIVPTQRINAIKAALICAETVLKETSTQSDQNYWNKVTEYLREVGKIL